MGYVDGVAAEGGEEVCEFGGGGGEGRWDCRFGGFGGLYGALFGFRWHLDGLIIVECYCVILQIMPIERLF